MAEASTQRDTPTRRETAKRHPGETDGQGGAVVRHGTRPSGLQTEKGSTTIADAVVTNVASIAAREIGGVYELGGGAARAVGSVAQRVGIGDQRGQGVAVEVGESEAAVDLTIVVEYGESIPRVAERIRENVIRRIEGMTGLKVTEVNVAVNDLHFAGDEQSDEPSRVQ